MRHRRPGLALALAIALLLASCTDSADPATTSTTLPTTTSSAPVGTTTTIDPLDGVPLPQDPDIVQGTLGNGLAYYIRENDSPGGRAELRLMVDAGSVQEDPDQAGMAHFLEHMMFNGTERFPRNELISVLEAFGPRFGPDINASTSFDETIYELSLSTADPALVQLGMEVLREWATNATLTETDVIEERGVILDEWRLRAQGFAARVTEELQQLILRGSAYEGHDPIGTPESIESTTPAHLRRFYEDWYHPERMAIVAVGDFDASDMQDLIVESFEDMPPVDDPRAWEQIEFDRPAGPVVSSYTDEEATVAEVSVLWPVASTRLVSTADYRDSLAMTFGLDVVAERLRDDASSMDGPLLGATVIDFDWTRAIGVRGFDVEVRANLTESGLEDVLTEIERIRRFGITDDEFERVANSYNAVSRQLYEQRESIQDVEVATQIVSHHLSGGHLMSPEQRFEVEADVLEGLKSDDVERALVSMFEEAPVVLILGPDDPGLDIPSGDRIIELIDAIDAAQLDERGEADPGASRLMQSPAPVPVSESSVDDRFEYTTLEYDNGATVYLWESDIAAGSVYLLVEGFGGTSLIDVEDLPEAYLMTDIVGRSGVADIDLPQLRRLLADRIVGVQPWLTETRHGLEGSSASEDVEWLFQLLHLTMVEPRFSPMAVDAVLGEMETLNASRDDLPDLLFDEAINGAYYGDDPRYFVVPTARQLADFDVAAAERVYREAFDNAGDFAFVLVGDFDTAQLTDLASRYIGTLPGGEEPTGFVDHQPLPAREVQVLTVEAGSGDQGQIGMFFTNEFQPELTDRVTARLLELIVSARLRNRIREELSATYSIVAGVDLQRDPDPFAEAFITSTGDPSGLDEISEEIVADLADLQSEGPSQAEFATAVAQLRDELGLIDNPTVANALVTAHLYPDQPVADLSRRVALLAERAVEDVTDLARAVFDLDQRIEVRQVPRP